MCIFPSNAILAGVELDNLLFWSDHIDYLIFMMGKAVAVSRKCSASVMIDGVRCCSVSPGGRPDFLSIPMCVICTKDYRG